MSWRAEPVEYFFENSCLSHCITFKHDLFIIPSFNVICIPTPMLALIESLTRMLCGWQSEDWSVVVARM